jgi:DNA-binding NarL/FixJ family response regulator
MTNSLSGAKALKYLAIRGDAIVYKAVPPNTQVQVGDFLPAVTRQRKDYYDWQGACIDCDLLIKTLRTQDPAYLDSAPQPRTRSRLPTPRDMAILALLRQGYSLSVIAAHYGVSRQSVHKVANKLRANGIALHP